MTGRNKTDHPTSNQYQCVATHCSSRENNRMYSHAQCGTVLDHMRRSLNHSVFNNKRHLYESLGQCFALDTYACDINGLSSVISHCNWSKNNDIDDRWDRILPTKFRRTSLGLLSNRHLFRATSFLMSSHFIELVSSLSPSPNNDQPTLKVYHPSSHHGQRTQL